MSYPRNTEIFGENESADYVHKVISGTVRTYEVSQRRPPPNRRLLSARRHFRLGVRRTCVFRLRPSADAKVLVVRRSALTRSPARETGMAAELFELSPQNCGGCRNGSCFWSRARRSGWRASFWKCRSPGANAIELPMSRQDIADYLGLTIETVSRTLTSLESAAAIEVTTARQIGLRNRNALCRMNG